ncbi:hypothetical protein RB195_024610 [Necator americanus]|uniref:Uncharacterized protein n=1 Tax=Necator americanus TaxID=51031 RepID=A0ABR1ENW7_NECAM
MRKNRRGTSVAKAFGIVHSIVSRAWGAFRTAGTVARRRGGGRLRSTAADVRHVVQDARRDPANWPSDKQTTQNSRRATVESEISCNPVKGIIPQI